MKRRERNEMMKTIATAVDEALATAEGIKPETAAKLITCMQMIDEKFGTDHTKRLYLERVRKGEIKLEKTVN